MNNAKKNATPAAAAETAATETAVAVMEPTTETAVATTSPLVARIMKHRAAQAVQEKTASIIDLFKVNAHSRKYNDGTRVLLPVAGISAKYIPKYHNESKGNRGYLITFKTADGELFTTFSGAFLRFVESILEPLGQTVDSFAAIGFSDRNGKPAVMEIEIREDTFTRNDEAMKTYRVEVVGGNAEKVNFIGTGAGGVLADAVNLD